MSGHIEVPLSGRARRSVTFHGFLAERDIHWSVERGFVGWRWQDVATFDWQVPNVDGGPPVRPGVRCAADPDYLRVDQLLRVLGKALRHEVDECFLVDGVPFKDPHPEDSRPAYVASDADAQPWPSSSGASAAAALRRISFRGLLAQYATKVDAYAAMANWPGAGWACAASGGLDARSTLEFFDAVRHALYDLVCNEAAECVLV